MNLNTYAFEQLGDELQFLFVSTDLSGNNRVIKIVSYDQVDYYQQSYYNLGFADIHLDTGIIDDKGVTNNGDMRKILSTVVATLPVFFEKHPDQKVHVSGSTFVRKQYYHKLARDYYTLLVEYYNIEGCVGGVVGPFERGVEYEFILISLKR